MAIPVSLLVVIEVTPWSKYSGLCAGLAGALMLHMAGCATPSPFATALRIQADPELTPERVVADYPKIRGRAVLWGGRILESRNLADRTEITVLAFPIDSSGAPQTEDDVVIGRFVAVQSGYLETLLYTPGREITVYGQVRETHDAVLGENRYQIPVVTVMQIHLWPQPQPWQQPWWSSFHFGIGITGGF